MYRIRGHGTEIVEQLGWELLEKRERKLVQENRLGNIKIKLFRQMDPKFQNKM